MSQDGWRAAPALFPLAGGPLCPVSTQPQVCWLSRGFLLLQMCQPAVKNGEILREPQQHIQVLPPAKTPGERGLGWLRIDCCSLGAWLAFSGVWGNF